MKSLRKGNKDDQANYFYNKAFEILDSRQISQEDFFKKVRNECITSL